MLISPPEVSQRVSVSNLIPNGPFMITPELASVEFDDQNFTMIIEITTFDPVTGISRGCRSQHVGGPALGKSGLRGLGYRKFPPSARVSAVVTLDKARVLGLTLTSLS